MSRNYGFGIPVHLLAFGLSFYQPYAALSLCILLWSYWAITSGKVATVDSQNHEH